MKQDGTQQQTKSETLLKSNSWTHLPIYGVWNSIEYALESSQQL